MCIGRGGAGAANNVLIAAVGRQRDVKCNSLIGEASSAKGSDLGMPRGPGIASSKIALLFSRGY